MISLRNAFTVARVSSKVISRCAADLDPPLIWSPGPNAPPGPNPQADMDHPPRIWTASTKLSENTILNVLVEIDNTLHSSAY